MGYFLRDRAFWIAMAAGPVVWLALHAALVRGDWFSVDLRALLVTGLLYPIIEELAFRGAIQTWLIDRGLGRPLALLPAVSTANLLTSALFASAHLYSQAPVWALTTFFPSLIFGHFRERTGGVSVPILLHAWYNIGFLIVVVR